MLHAAGVTSSARASHRLFTAKALLDGPAQYPSVSQKYLKAAASRFLIYFMLKLAKQRYSATGAEMDFSRVQVFGAIASMLTIFAEHGFRCSREAFSSHFHLVYPEALKPCGMHLSHVDRS